MAEVVLGVRILGVSDQLRQKDVGVEEIDAHGSIDHFGIEGRSQAGFLGLFDKAGDLTVTCHLDHAEGRDLAGTDGEGSDGDLGPAVDVLLEHEGVIHLVDVIAGEDEDVLRLLGPDGVDILVDGVRGSLIPGLGDALHRRQDLDKVAQLIGSEGSPALADVAIEGERLVLGEDVHPAKVRIDAVGEGDVDDAVLTGKRYSRLCAIACQREETFPGTTG